MTFYIKGKKYVGTRAWIVVKIDEDFDIQYQGNDVFSVCGKCVPCRPGNIKDIKREIIEGLVPYQIGTIKGTKEEIAQVLMGCEFKLEDGCLWLGSIAISKSKLIEGLVNGL